MAMLYFSQITPICSWLLQVDLTAVLRVVQRQNGAAEENTFNSAICWLNKCGAVIPEPQAVTQTTVDSEELNLQDFSETEQRTKTHPLAPLH